MRIGLNTIVTSPSVVELKILNVYILIFLYSNNLNIIVTQHIWHMREADMPLVNCHHINLQNINLAVIFYHNLFYHTSELIYHI